MVTTKVYANMSALCYGKRLDGERLRRIIEAKTVAEAFKMLGDYGFCYTDGCTVDKFIVDETDRLIDFIEQTASSQRLAEALVARFKYNNAKLAYKSRFISVPSDGYYRVSDFEPQKIASGDYEQADPYMKAALERLDEKKNPSPREIDIELTRAMYSYVTSCRIAIVKKYFAAEIDMKNILAAARMKKLGISEDEFAVGGEIGRNVLNEAVTAENFSECFENTRYAEYAQSIEQNGLNNLWQAEYAAEDYLFYLTDSQVVAFSSYKPFLNCYTEALVELKTIKTALVCIKTDSRDMFYKRIPKLYAA